MSFDTLKVAELRNVAESFGVDLEGAKNKKDIIAMLAEEGVTYEVYDNLANTEKTEDSEIEVFYDKKQNNIVPEGQTVLVKMDRGNPLYEIGKHVFTKVHPYVAMTEEDAQEIFDTEDGFRLATPSEVKDFYS